MCSKMILFHEKKWKIQIIFDRKNWLWKSGFCKFDDCYECDRKTYKLLNGVVVGFAPKGMSGRM